jgi:hypothetical protein
LYMIDCEGLVLSVLSRPDDSFDHMGAIIGRGRTVMYIPGDCVSLSFL